ncbi:MAG: ATP-binding protein [Bacteroidales bacterium]|nr:ATP-binding protein [Bacteroidales bacterium]
MKPTPFNYGKTISNQSFTNRKKELLILENNLLNGINTMIISPRRWGKSSLVEKALQEISLKNKKVKVVKIDLFSVNDEQSFLELFAKEVIKSASTKWQEWMEYAKNIFKVLIPKISFGIDPQNDFSLSFDIADLKKNKQEILNLPEILGETNGFKFIIAIDEFQNIAGYPDFESLEKLMRSVWQKQQFVTYCLYGSKRHMMLDIFNNSSKPFYKFGDIIMLQKIERTEWVSFIVKKFAEFGLTISKINAGMIADLMKNHPWYVQQFSHYTFRRTETEATAEIIDEALNEIITTNSPLFVMEYENLSTTQLNLLEAIINGETQLMSTETMMRYKLGTPRNIAKNKISLINRDIIDESNGIIEFLDPVFEIWFKSLVSNK